MNIVHVKHWPALGVPALSKQLENFQNTFCISYKHSGSGSVYVLTDNPAVVNMLHEINPNCVELADKKSFLTKQLPSLRWSDPDFILSKLIGHGNTANGTGIFKNLDERGSKQEQSVAPALHNRLATSAQHSRSSVQNIGAKKGIGQIWSQVVNLLRKQG